MQKLGALSTLGLQVASFGSVAWIPWVLLLWNFLNLPICLLFIVTLHLSNNLFTYTCVFVHLHLIWPVFTSKPQNTERYKDPNYTDGRKLTSNKSYFLAIPKGMSKSQHGSLRFILILLMVLEMVIFSILQPFHMQRNNRCNEIITVVTVWRVTHNLKSTFPYIRWN